MIEPDWMTPETVHSSAYKKVNFTDLDHVSSECMKIHTWARLMALDYNKLLNNLVYGY